MTIDGILVYVNPNDKEWRNRYNTYIRKENDKSKKSLSDERIRDLFSIRGVLRSIESHMQFINKMYLVVQSESQVPEWIDRNNINVVLHEEFIPKELLPTFNSHTIEMFLHKIPGLSERYVVFNDDMLIMRDLSEDDLFDGMTPKDMFYAIPTRSIDYHYSLSKRKYKNYPKLRLHPHINNNILAHNYCNIKYNPNIYYRPNHGFVSFNKSFVEDVYNKFENDIIKSCTKFRDDINLYYYSYRLCNFLKYKKISLTTTNFLTLRNSPGKIRYDIYNNAHDCICLNDDGFNNKYTNAYEKVLNETIYTIFNTKSKYELTDIQQENTIINDVSTNKKTNNAICTVSTGCNKEDLIRWVNYNKSIGFDNIIFYDLSDDKTIYNILLPFIKTKFIIYHSNINKQQYKKIYSYKNCYNTYKYTYSWIAFIDTDEYIILDKYNNINKFLNNTKFNNAEIIQLNRKNVIIENDSIIEFDDDNIKSIIRTNNVNITFIDNEWTINKYDEYSPNIQSVYNVYDTDGNLVGGDHLKKNSSNSVYIKHEFCTSFSNLIDKLKLGNINSIVLNQLCYSDIENTLNTYFKYIPLTTDKLNTIKDVFPYCNICGNKLYSVPDKIDLVFPYVDDQDPIWKEDYNKYMQQHNLNYKRDNLFGEARYNNFDLLKYKLRSIEQFMPWVNNIYILVAHKEQIPEWLNTKNVKVIYHKDFIPSELLPCFNSSTIEMFLGNIPGLSEHFIYSNDDFYVTQPISPDMFFRNNKSLLYFYVRSNVSKHPASKYGLEFQKNNMQLIYDDLNCVLNPGHGDKPMFKSTCKEVLIKYKNYIRKSVSRFRYKNNYNQYIYHLYDIKHNNAIAYERPFYSCFKITPKDIQSFTSEFLNNSNKYYTISLDFNIGEINNYFILYIKTLFNQKYNKKSKFEL